MKKIRLPTLEQIFVLTAVITIFTFTVYYMSTAGILPGNDPAVHLGKAERIVLDERVTYSAVPWYPPLFHAILAVLQIFSGTLDVIVAAFILKMLIATLNVLIMLSAYLLTRKLLGIGSAVASAVFITLSVPLFEMVFWGGYANFLGLAYIVFIFYIMNTDFQISVKTFLLFLGAFTIVLSHQLATFVFVLMFVPAYLFSTVGSKKRLLVLLGLIVGGSLALLAWYARILLENDIVRIMEHLFFTMEESVYNIPEVGLDALIRNNFGVSLFFALAGIPLTYIVFKKKSLKALVLLVLWIAIPLTLSQSYLFGLYLPYIRFVYFFATPIAILAGTFTYSLFKYSLTRIPALIKSKITSNITRKSCILAVRIFSLALIITLLLLQSVFFVQRNETYPQFYERASIASYNSGIWIKQHSIPEGTIVTSRSPGTWFHLFSGYEVIQEIDPQYSRSSVAEAVLYSFYEMDNTRTLNREYTSASSSAGQTIYASVYNIWKRGISIPNKDVSVIYVNPHVNPLEEWVPFPLNETEEKIYWTHRTADEAQLVSEYTHRLFTVKKVVTFTSNSSVININWKVKANQYFLKNNKMLITNYLDPTFQFMQALVPGFIEWQNPWDKPSHINPKDEWALIEGDSHNLDDDVVAVLDAKNRMLAVFDFHNTPDNFSLGALGDHKIDALRLQYNLDNLGEGDSREISFSVLFCSLESEELEQGTLSEIEQLLELKTERKIQEGDFYAYIEEYNIKFAVIDTQQVLSNIEASPDLDRIYDNSRSIVFATKR